MDRMNDNYNKNKNKRLIILIMKFERYNNKRRIICYVLFSKAKKRKISKTQIN